MGTQRAAAGGRHSSTVMGPSTALLVALTTLMVTTVGDEVDRPSDTTYEKVVYGEPAPPVLGRYTTRRWEGVHGRSGVMGAPRSGTELSLPWAVDARYRVPWEGRATTRATRSCGHASGSLPSRKIAWGRSCRPTTVKLAAATGGTFTRGVPDSEALGEALSLGFADRDGVGVSVGDGLSVPLGDCDHDCESDGDGEEVEEGVHDCEFVPLPDVVPVGVADVEGVGDTAEVDGERDQEGVGDWVTLGVRDGLPVGVPDSLVLEEDEVDGEGEGDGVSETVEDGEWLTGMTTMVLVKMFEP